MKKLIRKTFLVSLGLWTASLLFVACETFSDEPLCDCGDVPEFFDVDGISNLIHQEQDSRSILPPDTSEEAAVSWQNHELLLELSIGGFLGSESNPQTQAKPFFSLISSAYACTCLPPGWNGSNEIIQELNIITMNDYDSLHKAGDSLNDILSIIPLGFGNDEQVALTDYLQIDSLNVTRESYRFRLQQGPSENAIFQVKLVSTLRNTDGREENYEIESPSIRLSRE